MNNETIAKKRVKNNEKIIDWIVNKIKNEYAEDVAMLLIYGSYVNGTANALSDVDFYFIPKTDRGREMTRTFVINGIGYDLFPMSWARVEGIAAFKEPITPLVGNVRIEYYSTEEDLLRFKQIQEKLKENLSDEKYMRDVAIKNLDKAMSKYTKMVLSNNITEMRVDSGNILLLLSDSVAYLNQTYFRNGLKKQVSDLENMKCLPSGYVELYKAVIEAKTIEDISQRTLMIIKETSQMVEKASSGAARPRSTNYEELKCVYEELLSTWNKVKVCCQEGNKELAFISGISLQGVLDWVSEDYVLPKYDLMGVFDSEDLMPFEKKAECIRVEIADFLKLKGLEIKDYESFEEFSTVSEGSEFL